MLKSIRTNPILDQTMRANRWLPPWVSLGLLIVALAGGFFGRDWVAMQTTAEARGLLLRVAWLLPLVTLMITAALTARRMGTESFQMIRQAPLPDRQVTWGVGLSVLYVLRLMLIVALGLVAALAGGNLWRTVGQVACLAGLHLIGATLGAALVLRWGRKRLGVVLTGAVSIMLIASLAMIDAFVPDAFGVECLPYGLTGTPILITSLLIWSGGARPFVLPGIALLSVLLSWAISLIPWRSRERGWLSPQELEIVGGILVIVALISAAALISREGERPALAAIYHATSGQNWPRPLNENWPESFNNGAWLSDEPYCAWGGVGCVCGRVVNLNLSYQNLRGPFPAEIADLPSLENIDLISNQFSSLPPEIAELPRLQSLTMINNTPLSQVPPEMSRMSSLESIDFLYTSVSKIPPDICRLPHIDPWPVVLCEFIEPLPDSSPEIIVPLPDGAHACGIANMVWGTQAFDLADYPACQRLIPDVRVYCLTDKGQWTDEGIRIKEMVAGSNMIVVESERTGICGIFP